MDSENQNDGNPVISAGTAEPSTSQVSEKQSQPLPDYVEELRSQNAHLLEQLSELGTQVKGLQKGTDKQIGQVRNDIKRILDLKEQGLGEEQIQRELFLDSLMQGQGAPQTDTSSDKRQSAPPLDVENTLKSLKFAENDPALAALRIKYGNKPSELIAAAADLRISQLTSPNPSGANGFSQQGNTDSAGMSLQQIEEKSATLQRLYDNYTKNEPQIKVLEKEISDYWAKQKK